MNDIPELVGILVAVLILVAILLAGLGLIAIEWLDRHVTRKQKVLGAAFLLVIAVLVATRGVLQIYGG